MMTSMLLDATIILAHLAIILFIGIRSRQRDHVTSEELFLNSRELRWPSIALSNIGTNIHLDPILILWNDD